MKNRVKLFALALMGVLVYACGGNKEKEPITIVSYEVIDAQYDAEPPVVKFEGEEIDYNIYAKAEFSDGSWAHYIECYGPINSVAEFFDSKGRRISTWADASECFTQYIVYNYDERGRLLNMRYLYFEEIEDGYKYRDGYNKGYENSDAINDKYNKIARDSMEAYFGNCEHLGWIEADSLGYVTFRNKIEQLDYSVVDTFWCSQVNFEYDKQGELARVYEIPKVDIYDDIVAYDAKSNAISMGCLVNEIVATDEYELQYTIKPSQWFWASDIRGGFIYLEVTQVTRNNEENDNEKVRIIGYRDFVKAYDKTYRYGQISEYTIFHIPGSLFEYGAVLIYSVDEDKEGNLVVTRKYENGGDVLKSIWKQGRKISKSLYSRYGTELNRETYGYVKTGVNTRYYKINYTSKKLEFEGNKFRQYDEDFTEEDLPTIEEDIALSGWECYDY